MAKEKVKVKERVSRNGDWAEKEVGLVVRLGSVRSDCHRLTQHQKLNMLANSFSRRVC